MIYEDLVGRLQAYYVRVSGAGIWGGITGNIDDQDDLNTKFNNYVPKVTQLTINGQTYDLSADRSWTIATGIAIGDTITSATAGSVLFAGASGALAQDNANLFWDDANNRLGIGVASPVAPLEVSGASTNPNDKTGTINIVDSSNASRRLYLGINSSYGVSGSGYIQSVLSGARFSELLLNPNGGNVGIGLTSPSAKLHTQATTATDIVIIAQGTTAQTGNLFEARNVGGSVLASISAYGAADFNSMGAFIAKLNYINSYDNSISAFYIANSTGNTQFLGGIFQFGGTTSSFPAIKRNGTQIDIRLADDSAYTNIQAATGIFSAITLGATDLQTTLDTKTAKLITFNRQASSYTLVLGDADKAVEVNNASANTLTVPPNSTVAFPTGTQIIITQYGAGQTTITAGAGVTLRSASGALKISAQYGMATLIKVGTDEWYVGGSLTV